MVGLHHRCNGHELGQTLGDGEGQRGLAYCSPWDCSDNWGTEQYRMCSQVFHSAEWHLKIMKNKLNSFIHSFIFLLILTVDESIVCKTRVIR